MTMPDGSPQAVRHIVTATVVAHDGQPWLDELFVGLREQARQPDRVVGIDTASQDGSREALVEAFSGDAVLDMPRTAGFGRAVSEAHHLLPTVGGTAGAPATVEWLWLLHDDCAPDAGALDALLRIATTGPNVGIVGPKLREWPNSRRLIEMGVSIASSGARETGLEYVEFDQGQHDEVHDVLAVSSAGMLIRRDIYDEVGGFDPRLPVFRDDVDLGWRVSQAGYRVLTCPDALLYHAEAAHKGMRELHVVSGRNRRVDRRHALLTLLSNVSALALPFVAARLAIGSLLRALFLLLVKWPDAAYDEAAGMAGAFAHPAKLLTSRRFRKRRRRVSARAVRRLRPPPWIGIQHAFDTLMALVSARTGTHSGSARRRRRQTVETGPVAEEAEELQDQGTGVWHWLITRPLALIVVGLAALTAIAGWGLWGGGHLHGGGLLPAADSAGELWQRYVEAWHPVGTGSDAAAPPYLAALAAVGFIFFFGKAALAVDVLLMAAVPLAGLTGYLFARHVARSRPVRVWATITYALLPATTGAVAGGRLGTCVAIVLVPLLAIAVLRSLGARPGSPRGPSWPAAFMSAFLLALVAAFVPIAYVAALLLAVLAAASVLRGRWNALLHLAVPVVVAPALLLPWSVELITRPALLLSEAGRVGAASAGDSSLAAYAVALGNPGGSTAAPVWLFGVLVVAAIVALARSDRTRGVLTAWAVALVGLMLGLVQASVEVSPGAPAWSGFAAALVVAGLVAAVAHAGDGAKRAFGRLSFSWRQPLAGVLTVLVAGTPLVAAAWWVATGAADPLRRTDGLAVPAYIAEAMDTAAGKRTLLVQAHGEGDLRYNLLRGAGPRLGDSELQPADDAPTQRLGTALSDLSGGADEEVVERLRDHAVGYIFLPKPADQQLAEQLDTTSGLARASAPTGAAAWKVQGPVGRLRVVASDGAKVLPSQPVNAEVKVRAGQEGRQLVLAEPYGDGWNARVQGGSELEPVRHAGWAQAFRVPAGGAKIDLSYADSERTGWLVAQGIVAVLTVVFMIPARGRETTRTTPVPPRRRQGIDSGRRVGPGGSRAGATQAAPDATVQAGSAPAGSAATPLGSAAPPVSEHTPAGGPTPAQPSPTPAQPSPTPAQLSPTPAQPSPAPPAGQAAPAGHTAPRNGPTMPGHPSAAGGSGSSTPSSHARTDVPADSAEAAEEVGR